MGEIADAMLNGDMDCYTGEWLGDGGGYPRSMDDDYNKSINNFDRSKMATTKDGVPIDRPSKINCLTCNKLVKKKGLSDHNRDVHGI